MSEAQPFAIRVLATSEHVRSVRVEGELDLATAPELAAVLPIELQTGREVVLDLSAVSFIDSSGLRVLLEAINEAKINGWDLQVAAAMADQVKHVFELTDTLTLLPLTED